MDTYTVTCEWCGKKTVKKINGGHRSRFCDKSCSAKWRTSTPGYIRSLGETMKEQCRKQVITDKMRKTARRNMEKLRARPDVQEKIHAHLHGATNPFNNPAVQRKAALALRERGYGMLNGGNGRPAPIPQQMLAARLGWAMEYPVTTKMKRNSGYPTCYKIDIADPVLMIGIEVDGEGHHSKRALARDLKKVRFLGSLGWRILRFTNKEILEDLDSAVSRILEAVRSSISKPKPETT